MRPTDEAKTWMEDAVRETLARRGGLPAPARENARHEMLSHLHAAGERRAARAGRDEVEPEDARAAFAEMGGHAALEAAFLPPPGAYARASVPRRLGAHALDVAFVYGGIMALWAVLFIVLAPLFTYFGVSVGHRNPDPTMLIDADNLPWSRLGQDPLNADIVIGFVMAGLAVALPLAYYAWFESRRGGGRTPGKRILGLRVLRRDGAPLSPGAALVRNLVKASPLLMPLALLDALFIPLDGRGQRASDRLADAIVIHDDADAGEAPAAAPA